MRRAVANVGLIDSQYISVADNYPGTLERLPLWDSMDWVEFMLELEFELGETISDGDGQRIVSACHFERGSLTVAEMCAAVYLGLAHPSRG